MLVSSDEGYRAVSLTWSVCACVCATDGELEQHRRWVVGCGDESSSLYSSSRASSPATLPPHSPCNIYYNDASSALNFTPTQPFPTHNNRRPSTFNLPSTAITTSNNYSTTGINTGSRNSTLNAGAASLSHSNSHTPTPVTSNTNSSNHVATLSTQQSLTPAAAAAVAFKYRQVSEFDKCSDRAVNSQSVHNG